jgi:hypothetical protein
MRGLGGRSRLPPLAVVLTLSIQAFLRLASSASRGLHGLPSGRAQQPGQTNAV